MGLLEPGEIPCCVIGEASTPRRPPRLNPKEDAY